MLSTRSLQSATVLYIATVTHYTVLASNFLVSAASCKAIYGVASIGCGTRGAKGTRASLSLDKGGALYKLKVQEAVTAILQYLAKARANNAF